jgi:predicted RND superfamily exporter protein
MKTFIFFALSIVSLIIALVIFFKSLDIKALFILLFGLAAGVLFWMGLKEYQKEKETGKPQEKSE